MQDSNIRNTSLRNNILMGRIESSSRPNLADLRVLVSDSAK